MATAWDVFETAIERASHLVQLYDLLHDSRQRAVRADWADSFNRLMHWPVGEQIVRIDGTDRDSLLVLRESVGIDREHFTHDYVSELLRASVVASISALDRYMHDIVLHHSWALLQRADADIPKELKKIAIPITTAKSIINKLKDDPKSRPGHIAKKAIQERLHRDYTFQKPGDILKASKMLGISNFWQSVADEMDGTPPKNDVIKQLREIAKRRNQIVHEADVVLKTKAKDITLRDISRTEAEEWTEWIYEFVWAVDTVIENAV